ncbi:MAG: hypothetical protein M3442_10060 [Chloroflexota bacterium]|nr:hypothetical protein [Chloroflexota bacterium]
MTTKKTNQTRDPEAKALPIAPPTTGAAAERSAGWPDPVPEQQPWHTPEDAKGWRTVYRGSGQPRQVKNSVVLDLSPEQWAWLQHAAAAAGLTPHDVLGKLVDDARAAATG